MTQADDWQPVDDWAPIGAAPAAASAPQQAPPQPSMLDRLQTNPVLGAPLQTLLRSGQGIEQLLMHAASSLPAIGGQDVNDRLSALSNRADAGINAQNQNYEQAGSRVDAASTDPRLSGALRRTGEVGGNFLNPAGMAGSAMEATPGWLNAGLRGATSGAGFGSSQPVLGDTSNYWSQKAGQVAPAAGVGGITGLATHLLTLPTSPKPPTTKELFSDAGDQYKAVAAKPVPITPEMADALSGQSGVAAINRAMEGAEANRETGLINEFKSLLPDNADGPPNTISAEAAEKIRRAFKGAARAELRSPTGNDNIARGMNSRAADVNNALDTVPEIKDARGVWARAERSQIIDETIQSANDRTSTPAGAGDLAQSLRKEFGKLITSKDFDSFSQDEQAAIKHVANGTLTSNTLQRLGKFSPVRNHLMAYLEIATGLTGAGAAGPYGALGGVGLAALGEGSRQLSGLASNNAANAASELVRGGRSLAPPPGPIPNLAVGHPFALPLLLRPHAQ